jgi:heptosyltransferase-1
MRLLIVRLSAMGDVIHALPLAKNARVARAEVGWVVEHAFAGLLSGNPDCDRIFTADTKTWRRRPLAATTLGGIAALRRELRAFAADRTIDAQGLWKSAVVARLAGAPVAGFARAERREPASAVLCDLAVTPTPDARHVVDRNLDLLSAVGIPVSTRAPDARYLVSGEAVASDAFLASLPRPFAVFHPGAGRPEKTWGEDRFARLASALRDRVGLHPVVSWGPGDEARADRLSALLPGLRRAPLLDFAGLARLLSEAALFAGGDTGPLHLADALGVPTLALYGPTDADRNGPYGDRRGVLTRMREVSDDAVLARAVSVLEAPRGDPSRGRPTL